MPLVIVFFIPTVVVNALKLVTLNVVQVMAGIHVPSGMTKSETTVPIKCTFQRLMLTGWLRTLYNSTYGVVLAASNWIAVMITPVAREFHGAIDVGLAMVKVVSGSVWLSVQMVTAMLRIVFASATRASMKPFLEISRVALS